MDYYRQFSDGISSLNSFPVPGHWILGSIERILASALPKYIDILYYMQGLYFLQMLLKITQLSIFFDA